MAAGIVYKDNRMSYHIPDFTVSTHARSFAGYTIVFKDDVTEETVMKYMSDIVDAGGRLTQAYDPFLNVCANTSPATMVPIATAVLISNECHRRASALLSLRIISKF
jgi:hypothetical protein